jgi:hypothetical protein
MGNENKMRSTKNGKKTNGAFRSKHITHDQQSESAKAVFDVDNKQKDKS